MRNVHKVESKFIEYEESVGPYKCREGCRISTQCSSELRLHLINQHNFSGFKGENKSFNSYEGMIKIKEPLIRYSNFHFIHIY